MDITNLNTYQMGPERAFEALCNQLFERWVRVTYPQQVAYFQTVNGAGGDGGVEAYADLVSGQAVGVQSKCFLASFQEKQINQIRKSATTAMRVRPHLQRYVICIPRELQSVRMGQGQKITGNVEAKRFQDLKKELTAAYPNLTIDLWDLHQLRLQLQVPGNEGIRRFWFEKAEVSQQSLQQAFVVAKAGWLRERYSPDLHHQGRIQRAIATMLLSSTYRQTVTGHLAQLLEEISTAEKLLEEFRRLTTPSAGLETHLLAVQAYWQDLNDYLRALEKTISLGQDNPALLPVSPPNVRGALAALRDEPVPTTLRNVKPRLLAAVSALANRQLEQRIAAWRFDGQPHHLVILGRPGTGKTHGLAKAVEQHLRAGWPAVIIRAKGTPSQDWPTILRSALGGLAAWSAEEIWSGLEALAVRADSYRAQARASSNASGTDEPTKVLVCVDGVDEATNPADWKIRVDELRAMLLSYPRLRVVVSSRGYPPGNPDPVGFNTDALVRKLQLPRYGDVPVAELVPDYLREYGISYDQMPWLTTAFQDALSLRLFAEKYRGQNLNKLQSPLKITLSSLLTEKVQLIEEAFARTGLLKANSSDFLAKRGMLSIANCLDKANEMDHEALCQQLMTDLGGIVTRPQAAAMLELYADFGLLLQVKTTADADDFLAETTITYTLAFQPLVDYFLSLKATRQQIESGNKDLPDALLRRSDTNALELTAVALLLDHGLLVGEDGYWTGQVDDKYLQALRYRALRNAPDTTIQHYLPFVIANFRRSDFDRNLVLEEFILPTLQRPQLDLVGVVVHDTLRGFASVFERDVFWASPTPYTPGRPEESSSHISAVLRPHSLPDWQPARGLPLLLGWSLATADNEYREQCRRQLTRWGQHNPAELLKLLDLLFFCGDDQVQEDLSRVMLGVASLLTTAGRGLQQLAAWVLQHVFAADRITTIRSSVVRACGRVVVERACLMGECAPAAAALAQPPYALGDDAPLPLVLGGPTGSQGERFPIVHDLAWYVIKKSYDGFLDLTGRKRTTAPSTALLQRYRGTSGEDKMGPYYFATSAALAYIKSLGYNRKAGEGAGFTQASHGALSKHGTLEEKYTWLAVHQLQGYLADRLPYQENGETHELLTDYQELVPLENPASIPLAEASLPWYVPVDISPALPSSPLPLAQELKAWVNRKDEPDFATWLNLPNFQPEPPVAAGHGWRPLYLDTHLSEPTGTGATTLEISCCLIAEQEWEPFRAYFGRHAADLQRWTFADADYLQARPVGPTYSSVQDVVSMPWSGEKESVVEIEYAADAAFTLHKTVVKITESSLEEGEQYPVAPSWLVRQHLGIVATDKTAFWGAQGQRLAHHQYMRQEDYDRQQLLVVDRDAFDEWCRRAQLKPFWIVCQYQTTSLKLDTNRKDLYFTNFRYWLVWEEAGELQHFLYHDGQYRDSSTQNAEEEDYEQDVLNS